MSKLKNVKRALKCWHISTIGNLRNAIAHAQARVDLVSNNMANNGFLDLLFQEEDEAHANLNNLLLQENMGSRE